MDHSIPAIEEALAYWYGLINYEQRPAHPGELKLERMRGLMAELGNPQQRQRIVHVAGSKGKGSTAAMLAAVFQAAGYRTGLFTSPHLVRVEERFQVDGRPITADELSTLLLEVRDAATRREMTNPGARRPGANSHHAVAAKPDAEPGIASSGLSTQYPPSSAPTFFEVATAAGILHFARRRVDATVLEVGLGGRFDSTNVCEPAAALITSISHDHTHLLGDQLASIAFEKAGILKPGRPAISGATVPEAREVIERVARARGCGLRQLGVDFHFEYRPGRVTAGGIDKPRVRVTTPRRVWPEFELNLLGPHQAANAAVAVACIEELRSQGWHLPDRAVQAGLAEVSWPARLEVLGRRPLIVLDCAHNVASALALVETLRTSFPPGRRRLVFAGSDDKDLAGMFRALSPHFDHAFLTRYTSNPRAAVPPERLAALLHETGALPATVHDSPAEALEAALGQSGTTDLICITGSVFLAGEVRPLLTTRPPLR